MKNSLPSSSNCTVAIIGLGYVGLPLALELAKTKICHKTNAVLNRKIIGYDINIKRLQELQEGNDMTNEVTYDELEKGNKIFYTNAIKDLIEADVFIITVPTPVDESKRPDLSALKNASKLVGSTLKSRKNVQSIITPLVIFESTVYPGATEEICVPIIESESGFIFNRGFFCGYSPERINPGDKVNTLPNVIKVTSGSTQESAEWIDNFYNSIVKAGTHPAPSIKVAEAAKVIENTQRDLNIALVNELALIFNRLDIDTLDVLEAAESKWNFLSFRPGLVGGHCIGVDPYYLTHKAEQVGYHPEVVLAGRRINDRMGEWVAERLILNMAQQNIPIGGSTVLLFGITFKENCPDIRNSKSFDIIRTLKSYSVNTVVHDPWAWPKSSALKEQLGCEFIDSNFNSLDYEALIIAVAHDCFRSISRSEWLTIKNNKPLLDLKGIVPRDLNPIRI